MESRLDWNEVVGFDSRGRALVKMEGDQPILPHRMFINGNGQVRFRPDPPDTRVDQAGGRPESVPVAERWRTVDQA